MKIALDKIRIHGINKMKVSKVCKLHSHVTNYSHISSCVTMLLF